MMNRAATPSRRPAATSCASTPPRARSRSAARGSAAGLVEGVTDDLSALKQEIERLSEETEALKQRLAKAEADLEAQKARPVGPSIQNSGVNLDEMNALADKIMRRLQGMVRELKRQDSERTL